MKNLLVFGFTFTLGIVLAFNANAAGNAAKGKAAYAVCLACHGADGMGNKDLNSPKIAGLSAWYLERQLKNFKAGLRGANPKDNFGMQMRPMALTLPNDQAIADMAAYVSNMPEKKISSNVSGDTNAGKAAYMLCQACHGANGGGNKALNAPRLAGQHDWYLVRQLKNFKAGIRGTKTGDTYGAQMRPMAMTLANDETVNNVAAYIATFK
ncbi:MAG: c-type cytochrome [SAR324 cluster bacterium]|jgi:cytochrome c oxidase subunit 2|nr:c-type cytochrome [SAR324 cluster bacterium]MCH2266697.1 c-type cytochrome [SAR324 cluster bacterium]HBL54970.1 cytochrome c oxidase subunit II [Deltaproteobacteria bacterium]